MRGSPLFGDLLSEYPRFLFALLHSLLSKNPLFLVESKKKWAFQMQELMDWLEYLEDGRQQCLKKHFENKAKGASHAIVVGKRPNFVDDLAQLEYNKGRILVAALPSADFLPRNENLMP